MLSESATSGAHVYLLRVWRKKGGRRNLQRGTERLVRSGLLSEKFLWGTPRFDRMIDLFIDRGLITEMPSNVKLWRSVLERELSAPPSFNEACRAARWILENWR